MSFDDLVKRLRAFRRDQRANAALIFAFCAVPLIFAIGTAIDYTRAAAARVKMQAALDAAVLSAVSFTATQRSQSDNIAYATNIFNAAAQSIGNNATANFAFNSDGSFSGSATASFQTAFMAIAHVTALPLGAAATAAAAASTTSVCILLLDPSAGPGMLLNSGANVSAANCEVDVKSQGNPSATFNSGTTLDTSKICLQGTSYINNGGAHPNLAPGCTTISDPFAGKLPAPPSTTCSGAYANGGNINGGSVNLSPGVYCGWLNFNNAPTVTFAPGVYVISGGGWNVNGGVWNGNGVTFYFADTSKIQFNSGMNMTLAAPTSGPYSGILMYEKSGLALSQFVFNDSVSESLNGLIYLPSRNVTFNSTSSVSSQQMTLVADTAIFNSVNWNLSASARNIPGTGGGGSSSASAHLTQ